MAKKPVILLTLCESLSNTVVVSQALGHARVMADAGVGTFHILAMAWNASMQADAENFRAEAEGLCGAPIHIVRGVRPALPGSWRINGARIARAVQQLGIRFTHVHARTDYSVVVSARAARMLDSMLIWDCRGDSLAELDFRLSGPAHWIARRVVERRTANAARLADRAQFVSHTLRRRMARVWPEGMPVEVIPCAASDRLFFFDRDLRRDARVDLGLDEQTEFLAVQQLGIRFTHVHARTDYSVVVSARAARMLDSMLIWDCRGDSLAELDFRLSGPAHWIARRVVERRTANAARLADRAQFVSHTLRRRMARVWPEGMPVEVIPCAASDRLFFFDRDLRRDARVDLGLDAQTPLYLYSGSLAPYQKFPEMLDLFQRIKQVQADAKLLILTADVPAASALVRDTEAVLVRSVANSEVNRYLNAADAAFMLRDKVATNIVASPTKFAEYGLAGLPVVMTDAVADSYAMAQECGNLVEVVDGSVPTSIPKIDRQAIAAFYRIRLGREAVTGAYRRLYA